MARTIAAWLLLLGFVRCAHADRRAVVAVPSDTQRSRLLPDLTVRTSTAPTSGVVVLSYDVGQDGGFENARVEYSLPAGHFDERAIADLGSWRLNPVPPERTDRIILLGYRVHDGGLEVTASLPVGGDCDPQSSVRPPGDGRRWVLASCSARLSPLANGQAIGWRSVARVHQSLDR